MTQPAMLRSPLLRIDSSSSAHWPTTEWLSVKQSLVEGLSLLTVQKNDFWAEKPHAECGH